MEQRLLQLGGGGNGHYSLHLRSGRPIIRLLTVALSLSVVLNPCKFVRGLAWVKSLLLALARVIPRGAWTQPGGGVSPVGGLILDWTS